MFAWTSRDKVRYTPLSSNERSFWYRVSPRGSGTSSTVAALLVLISVALFGFFAGRWSIDNESLLTIPLGTRSGVFRYNRMFGSAPSDESDAAWASLFPEQGGYFKHPVIAPERSAFAVFHQLHCLDGIRQGYWAVHDAAIEGRQMKEEDFTFMSSPPHIRHCIDLIRQSLVCQPDTTVEIKDKELGGVTGFGTMHQCRNWDELIAWTTKWQTYKQDPRQKDNDSTHDHHHHHQQQQHSG